MRDRGAFGAVDLTKWRRIRQDELWETEDGEEVTIIWSGGNGPHNYLLHRYVDKWGQERIYPICHYGGGWETPERARQYMKALTDVDVYIGEHPQTQVYRRIKCLNL